MRWESINCQFMEAEGEAAGRMELVGGLKWTEGDRRHRSAGGGYLTVSTVNAVDFCDAGRVGEH